MSNHCAVTVIIVFLFEMGGGMNKAPIEFSVVDSDRFGKKIFRGFMEQIEIEKLNKIITDEMVDVLILRTPSKEKPNHSLLKNLGFPYIHADTLVYYAQDLKGANTSSLHNNLKFSLVDLSNADKFEELIPVIFKDYQNHYFSNPLFERDRIIDGYVEWAKKYTTSSENGRVSWIISLDSLDCGFATCEYNIENRSCEGVLYGVHPNFSGRGIYSDIVRFTKNYFKQMGLDKMYVSTQVQNYSVQKAWIKEGFSIIEAFDTYHINALLSYGKEVTPLLSFRVSNGVIMDIKNNRMDELRLLPQEKDSRNISIFVWQLLNSHPYILKRSHIQKRGEAIVINKTVLEDGVYRCFESTLDYIGGGEVVVIYKVVNEKGSCCLVCNADLVKY